MNLTPKIIVVWVEKGVCTTKHVCLVCICRTQAFEGQANWKLDQASVQ